MSIEHTTTPKPFCFVLMPFSRDFDDVYQIGIKEACEAAGAYAERVDEQIFNENILERVFNQIAKSDLVVADMTGRNPNVFYEVGYAHALGKRTILLTRDVEDIPFDLKHFQHIVYGNRIVDLRNNLKTRIEYFVQNPVRRIGDNTIDIEIFIGPHNLSSGTVVHEFPSNHLPNAEITVHNASASTLEPGAFKIGVITDDRYPIATDDVLTSLLMPDGNYLHMLPDFATLLPNAFDSCRFVLQPARGDISVGEEIKLTLRVFTAVGTRDYSMRMRRMPRPPRES